jgi:hypothetical protein
MNLPLGRVSALLRAASAVGLRAPWGDGGPVVDVFLKNGQLCVGIKGRLNGDRRNPGDVAGQLVEASVVVPEGADGPKVALAQLERVVESYRPRPARREGWNV